MAGRAVALRRGAVPALAALLGVLACDADPVPGTLSATLLSPNGPEGAAYVTLFGPGIGQVSALDARTFAHAAGDTVHVVVIRDEPGQVRFQVEVSDTTRLPAALLVEVAGGDNRLRPDASSYRVELRP
jgi:hypothetical protein